MCCEYKLFILFQRSVQNIMSIILLINFMFSTYDHILDILGYKRYYKNEFFPVLVF